MQKINPFLWFNNNAEEAVNFYVNTFKNAKITDVKRNSKGMSGPEGSVFTMSFQINDQNFMALNGGPMFSFTPAISFFINCVDQEEVDHLWEKLSEGGEKQQCGWVKDKYGISWQVIPIALGELMSSNDAEKSKRVMDAMLKMTKIDISALQEAYEGK